MNISELIEYHKKGAEACEAYSGTPPDTRAVTKDICKHYQKKAAWHRDAVALLEKESDLQQRMTSAEKRLVEAYDWGYTDGQQAPNGYSDKSDRDKCVAELLKPEEGS